VRFVCAADAGVDRYSERELDRAGGIGLNVAVHARRLCAPSHTVTLVAPVGDDGGAGLVRDAMARAGVLACLEVVSGATPVQHIRHAADGERIFGSYAEGVLGGYRVSARQCRMIAGSDVLATTAFGQGLAFFESVMACGPGGLRAVDFTNANDVGDPVAFAERWAPELDVGLFGLQTTDGELIDALEGVAQRSGRLFVVTLGPAGSLALGCAARIACPAPTVQRVVDTTGAGDAFTAGFLCEYARGAGVATSLERASEVAAATLGHLGSFELPRA
jgi:fructoselysine 6-kinase